MSGSSRPEKAKVSAESRKKRLSPTGSLVTSGEQAGVELSEDDLATVAGGTPVTQDITVNKAKTADKAYAIMDAYIKG
ncbi:hypothetical protein [Labrys wisconsinensis]|uniref:Uncharacterized protein n=1 Tax=Labrys wisconsinensis TaxID=425677 RepID=A0ABU0JDX4_9HYPH|nr:hypothetical protein [Labrys wisconsinensis]MDQ0471598.1 hypothetical protein [Labrys wisconsinensis]